MNEYTIRIDQYLNNELGPEEKQAFEKELQTNPELKKELEIQQNIMAGLERVALKQEFSRAVKNHILKKSLGKWGGFSLLVVALGLATIFLLSTPAGNKLSTDALPEEMFEINAYRDTIIETSGGIVIGIPAGAFNASSGKVTLEIKEALTPEQIIGAGLSTTSHGELLQTAGMFYIHASENGKELSLLKSLDVNVPAGEINRNMMLFDGEINADGSINWVNPQPIQRDLRTYDITTLDFYPADYLPTLEALGMNAQNKVFTDSLYYSFSGYGSVPVMEFGNQPDSSENLVADPLFFMSDGKKSAVPDVQKGERIFEMHCTSCHSIHEKLVGPALKNIHLKHEESWLMKWIRNSHDLIRSGDPVAVKLFNDNNKSVMTTFNFLSDNDIRDILTYIKKAGNTPALTGTSDYIKSSYETDPSRIKAIWDPKYNHTILATREFEERLKYIHTLCNSSYLDLYINNLDKPLYVIDSMCMVSGGGEQFRTFYERKDGGVKINGEMQQKLSTYFTQKYNLYRQASEKTWQKYYAEIDKKREEATQKKESHRVAEEIRSSKVFTEELCKNMIDAYRQIGQEKKCPVPAPAVNYYQLQINTTGWKNLDQYVFASTLNRESMSYSDPVTGKIATITYTQASFTISDAADYDQLLVYLLPGSLSSFQKVAGDKGVFKEKLNALFSYDVVVLAYKGNQAYFFTQKDIEAKDYRFSLSAINENDLKTALSSYSLNKAKDLQQEADYRYFEQREAIRLKELRKEEDRRQKVSEAIFHCFSASPAGPAQ